MNKAPVSYLQTDSRWKNVDYSAPGEKTTIGASGCGPTAMAMVLATWADPSVTPKTEAAWALANGYKYPNQGTAYGYFAKTAARFGLICTQITPAYIYGNANSPYHAQAKAALDRGDYVIACMGKGLWTSSGHYVVPWKIEGNTIYINDPASTKAARTRGDYARFKREVKLYWVIKRPAEKKEENDMTAEEVRRIVEEMLDKRKERVYNTYDEVPEWAAGAVKKLLNAGALKGTGKGLGLTTTDLRQMVYNDRMGLYG